MEEMDRLTLLALLGCLVSTAPFGEGPPLPSVAELIVLLCPAPPPPPPVPAFPPCLEVVEEGEGNCFPEAVLGEVGLLMLPSPPPPLRCLTVTADLMG